jgi:hypothetical protein
MRSGCCVCSNESASFPGAIPCCALPTVVVMCLGLA